MRILGLVVFLALVSAPAQAQRAATGTKDLVNDACRAEAKQVITRSRTSRLDQEQLKQLRREYRRSCQERRRI